MSTEKIESLYKKYYQTIFDEIPTESIKFAPADNEVHYVSIEGSEYHYKFMERGMVTQDLRFDNFDDLMFEIFYDLSSQRSRDFELAHRGEVGIGSRKIAFAKRQQLLCRVSRDWCEKAQSRIDEIVKNAPYEQDEEEGYRKAQELGILEN